MWFGCTSRAAERANAEYLRRSLDAPSGDLLVVAALGADERAQASGGAWAAPAALAAGLVYPAATVALLSIVEMLAVLLKDNSALHVRDGHVFSPARGDRLDTTTAHQL